MSAAEELFFAAWQESPLQGTCILREHQFFPGRRWKIDFAVVPTEADISLPRFAIEVQGFGRHHTFMGASKDMEKARALVAMGWRYLPIPAHAVTRNAAAAVEEVKSVICGDVPDESCLI